MHWFVLQVTATDTDAGSNGLLTYSMVQNNVGNYFDIRDITGLDGTELYNQVVFDRERPWPGYITRGSSQLYKATVKAEDDGRPPLSENCFFFVTIQDINDQVPVFDDLTNEMTIPNNLGLNDRVGRVFALDEDEVNSPNSEVFYRLDEDDTNCPGCFGFNDNDDDDSGWILQKTASIPDGITRVNLRVVASDRGTPPQESNPTSVIINILEPTSVDLAPVWEPYNGQEIDDIVNLEIEENTASGTILDIDLKATNPNYIGPRQRPEYFVIRGRTSSQNSNDDFFKDSEPNDNCIVKVRQVDYEDTNEYWLPIRATVSNLCNIIAYFSF